MSKRLDPKRRLTLAYLASFPERNPNPVVEVDFDGRVHYANPAALRILPELGEHRLPQALLVDWDVFIRPFRLGQTNEIRLDAPVGDRIYELSFYHLDPDQLVRIYGIDITERKQAEEALRDSQERLRVTLTSIGDGVIATDADSRVTFLNPVAAALTGWLPEEALGLPINSVFKIIDEKSRQPGLDIIALTLRDCRVFTLANNTALLAKDGREIPIEDSAAPILDAARNVTGAVLVFHDVTEKRRAQNALNESQRQLSKAQELAHLGSWELDLVNARLTWSDEVYRIFGLQPQEFGATYEAFLEAVHPADRAAVDQAYSSSLQEGRDSYEIEHRVVKRLSGEVRVVHEKCEHIRNEAGAIIRSLGMVHDITERKLAEEALRLSEQRFRLALKNAPVTVAAQDKDLRFIWAYNQRTVRPADVIGKTDSDLFPPENAARLSALKRQVLATGAEVKEQMWVSSGGRQVYLDIYLEPSRDNSGQITGVGIATVDLTERKKAEQALLAAHAELERRVQERTQELAVANEGLSKEVSERKRAEKEIELERDKLKGILDTMQEGVYIVNQNYEVEYINPVVEQEFGSVNGRKCHQLFHDCPDVCELCLNEQVMQGKVVNSERTSAITGKVYDLLDMPLRNSDGSISKLRIMHDITHLKENERQIQQSNLELKNISQEEHKQRKLSEALVEAALALNKSMNLDEVLTRILEGIQKVIPYQFADIALLEEESFYYANHKGKGGWQPAHTDTKNFALLADFPILKKIRQSGQPVLISDVNQEPDWVTVDTVACNRSFLSAPLLIEKQVIGFVNLYAEQPDFFTLEMRDRLVAFAAHAAVAIQNAWLFEQVRASSERLQSLSHRLVEIQESERLYIARELHDEAGQLLTSMILDLSQLKKKASDPEVVIKKVAEMEGTLNNVMENLHRMAMALRPTSLDHLGLETALNQYVASVGEKHGLKISFRSEKFRNRLPANVETVLYRIVQEALTNVVRHAHATQVDVVLTVRDDTLIMIVEDNGIGFDPESITTAEHLGLFGMHERAEMIGGKLVIESTLGVGTTLMLEVANPDGVN